MKIVNFIQVVALTRAHLCGGGSRSSHRLLASVGRDKMQVPRLRSTHNRQRLRAEVGSRSVAREFRSLKAPARSV